MTPMEKAMHDAEAACLHSEPGARGLCVECALGAVASVHAERERIGCIEPHTSGCKSLTRREHFAAMAMQGLLANVRIIETVNSGRGKATAEAAVKMADALIDALATERQSNKE
jgi:hypothetical protein